MAGEPSNKNYMEPGGDKQVVASGGTIDFESGANFEIAGTAVTASAAELNIMTGVTATAAEINKLASLGASTADLGATSNLVDSITVVSANGTTNAADVVITLLDPDGTAIAVPTLVHVWLSDNANGLGGSAHTHSTGPAFTVGEEILEMITNDAWFALTTAAGTVTLRLLDTSAENVTINAGVIGVGIRGSDTTITADFTG